jgi:hypothetical protein
MMLSNLLFFKKELGRGGKVEGRRRKGRRERERKEN